MKIMHRTGLLDKLLSRRAPKRIGGARRWLPRGLVALQRAGPVSSIAMVMRRAHWQVTAARHTHAWLVQAILRASAPPTAPTPDKNVLRMVERHAHTTQMVSRIVQSLPARMQLRAPQASAAPTLEAAPSAVAATVRRAGANAGYPRMPMTMARTAATQPAGTAHRPDTPPHPGTASASQRNAPQARMLSPFASAAEPVTLPPLELARVTDHVVTQLEQRALSYRERMGGRP